MKISSDQVARIYCFYRLPSLDFFRFTSSFVGRHLCLRKANTPRVKKLDHRRVLCILSLKAMWSTLSSVDQIKNRPTKHAAIYWAFFTWVFGSAVTKFLNERTVLYFSHYHRFILGMESMRYLLLVCMPNCEIWAKTYRHSGA